MKFKSLFLGMLATAAMVSCNNEIEPGPNTGGGGTEGTEGESTTATFSLKMKSPGTYSGGSDLGATGREDAIADVGLFIYKLDGTPEAMAYIAASDWSTLSEKQITVKCKSGDKLIYLAANIAGLLSTHPSSSVSGTNTNSGNNYLGRDWNASGTYGPKFSVAYTDGDGNDKEALNSPLWSGAGSTTVWETQLATPPFTIPANTSANNLIQALTGNGTPTNGVLFGDGGTGANVYYLMANWGDANSQPTDEGGTNYPATVKFNLKPGITADESRTPTTEDLNVNALVINIQRSVAKVKVNEITTAVQNGAGDGTNAGTFTPDQKWAVGNINASTYPIQMWDGTVVKSTRYDETTAILPKASNDKWANKMDNSRFAGTNTAYEDQNLSASAIVGNTSGAIFSNTANRTYSPSTPAVTDYAIITENNNSQTYNQYSSFVVLSGVYTPAEYVTSVSFPSTVNTATTTPTYPGDNSSMDTMYYVRNINEGMFFHGMDALKQYVCYILGENDGGTLDPSTDVTTANYINDLRETSGSTQADLQEYWNGYCFYRIWIRDAGASAAANKMLVRRNHAYDITISDILGPGIGDPNDIIDPDPTEPEPIEEADTYVTAEINIMNWHVIDQDATGDLN